jgi:ABC-type nitrate/sulfonate/bicarbonate transport system substrate-binding protein
MAAASAQADDAIRVAYPSGMNGQLVVTMDKAGIAKKNGLNATFTAFQYGPPMMEALASGSLDAVVTSLMPVTSYASKLPGDAQIVAMLGHSSHSLMVDKASSINAPADLAGKKLGVSFGSDSHLDTLAWLDETSLKDKVNLVNVAPSDLATSLENRTVDAIVIRQPQVLKLEQLSGARIIKTWPFRFVSIVKTKFIEEQPEAYNKYLKSLHDSLFYVSQNQKQSADWFGEALRIDPAIVLKVSSEDPNYSANQPSDIDISITDNAKGLLNKWADDAFKYQMIRKAIDKSKFFR